MPFRLRDLLLFAFLVLFGVLGRWLGPEWGLWNFTPTAAVALFAAFYFADWRLAVLAPVVTLTVSNFLLPDYRSWELAVSVYAALAVPVLCGRWLRERFTAARFATGVVFPAVTFFFVTNFAWWLTSGSYAATWDGLVACYVHAIPFFRNTLAGDVVFSLALFGSYGVISQFAAQMPPRTPAYARLPRE